ncbi:MAG: ABC transporter ATP-binding protein [Corynebacteriales bacterium]|nr:ABC transporter ATP-binding protein [Mycobacteriales bacterium]
MTAESGQWLAIIGPNGAGKSTFLRALAGTVKFSGSLTVSGQDIQALHPRERAKLIAYAPQTPILPDDMAVMDYLLLGRTPHLGYLGQESAADRRIAAEVAARLDLSTLLRRPVGSLSGGERQRAILARALTQQAGVLLLDEPTTALDLGHQQQVLELVDELRQERGLTVVSTLHDLTLAGQYAHQLALLVDGRIVTVGDPAEVLTAQTIAEHYAATVHVSTGQDGRPLIALRRP